MPQLPDTRIALSGLGGGGGGDRQLGPLGTLGALMQIKEQQSLMRQRQLQAEKLQRDQEEDVKINLAMRNATRPEDGIAMLAKSGDWNAATKAHAQRNAQLKAQYEQEDKVLDTNVKRFSQASQWLNAIDPKDPTAAAFYDSIYPYLVDTLKPVAGDGVTDLVPNRYTPETAPRIAQLAMATTARGEQLTNLRAAKAQLVQAANLGQIANPFMSPGQDADGTPLPPPIDAMGAEVGQKWSTNAMKAMAEATDLYKKSIVGHIGLSRTPEEFQGYMDQLHASGVPQPLLDAAPQWGDYATPDEFKHAVIAFGRTQKETDDLAKQAKVETRNAGLDALAARRTAAAESQALTARERADNAETGTGAGGRGRQLTPTKHAELREARNKAFKALDDAFRGGADSKTGIKLTSDEETESYIARRLQIENDDRDAHGLDPLEVVAQRAVDAGDKASYDKIAEKYKGTTKGLRTLDQVVKWTAPASSAAAAPASPSRGALMGAPPPSAPPASRPVAAAAPAPQTPQAVRAEMTALAAELAATPPPSLARRVEIDKRLRVLRGR